MLQARCCKIIQHTTIELGCEPLTIGSSTLHTWKKKFFRHDDANKGVQVIPTGTLSYF